MAKKAGISFVAEDTRLAGDIESNARLVVEGVVDGNIRCADLTVSPSGRVMGDIQAGIVSLAGRYTGNIVAHQKLTVHATGAVEGKIFTQTLVIEEGGRVDGDIKVMSSVEEFPEYTP